MEDHHKHNYQILPYRVAHHIEKSSTNGHENRNPAQKKVLIQQSRNTQLENIRIDVLEATALRMMGRILMTLYSWAWSYDKLVIDPTWKRSEFTKSRQESDFKDVIQSEMLSEILPGTVYHQIRSIDVSNQYLHTGNSYTGLNAYRYINLKTKHKDIQ